MSSSKLLLPDLHTGFSRGRSGGLVFHLFQNFPHFIVIHTVKGFGIVNKAEIDVFLEQDSLAVKRKLSPLYTGTGPSRLGGRVSEWKS